MKNEDMNSGEWEFDGAVVSALNKVLSSLVRLKVAEGKRSIPAYLPQPDDRFAASDTATVEEWDAVEKIVRREAAEALARALTVAVGRAIIEPKAPTTRRILLQRVK